MVSLTGSAFVGDVLMNCGIGALIGDGILMYSRRDGGDPFEPINSELIDSGWYDVGLGFFVACGSLLGSLGLFATYGLANGCVGCTAVLVGSSTIVEIGVPVYVLEVPVYVVDTGVEIGVPVYVVDLGNGAVGKLYGLSVTVDDLFTSIGFFDESSTIAFNAVEASVYDADAALAWPRVYCALVGDGVRLSLPESLAVSGDLWSCLATALANDDEIDGEEYNCEIDVDEYERV